MTSRGLERTWIRTGGYGRLRGEWVKQSMDEKIKTRPLRFPAKENPSMEKALFDWPIVLQHDVKAKYRFLDKSRAPERSLNQLKSTRVCIRSLTQSNRSISVRLLFLFSSRVFISRSYENRSIRRLEQKMVFRDQTKGG